MKLVFATNNKNKIKEIKSLLPENIEILSLIDIGCTEEIEETQSTLEGNAQLKANYITKNYGYNCFADDTGLEVKYLNGVPGVYSARYAGNKSSSESNMQKLLTELQNIENRNAQFRTIIALNIDDNNYLFEGICKGDILKEKQGKEGFGYDPIFKPKGFSQSFAEMNLEQKGKISHRGLAVAELVSFLRLK